MGAMINARWQPPGGPPGWPPRTPGQPPGRPGGEPGGSGEGVGPFQDWLQERLFDNRIVVVRGRLDHERASRYAAQILALDAAGNDPIEMHIDCPDAGIEATIVLMDTIDLAGSPVHAVAAGQVGGAAVGLLATAEQRSALPHCRFRLSEPRADLAGTADQVVSGASQHLQLLEALILRVAEVTGQPRHRVEDDLSKGRFLTADQAVEYGLVDSVRGRGGANP